MADNKRVAGTRTSEGNPRLRCGQCGKEAGSQEDSSWPYLWTCSDSPKCRGVIYEHQRRAEERRRTLGGQMNGERNAHLADIDTRKNDVAINDFPEQRERDTYDERRSPDARKPITVTKETPSDE